MQRRDAHHAPLQGVRVVDFTWALAGPYGSMLLAFLGAEVIKIESAQRLDLSRRMYMAPGAKPGDVNKATSFSDFNLNKLGVTLNLQQPKAVEIVKSVIAVSDVVVNNFSPGVMDRLGLGYEKLRAIKPDIIMVSESAMGATGPEASYIGFAPTFNSLSGVGYLTGYPDFPPGEIRTGVDLRVGSTIAFGTLMALNYRMVSGRGQHVDISAREAMSALVGDRFLEYTMNKRVAVRQGNRDEIMAPHGCYRCKGDDKWVSVAIGTEEEWAAFCTALGNPAWCLDPRFADQQSRWLHQEEIDQRVEAWTAQYGPYEATEVLQKAGVAAFPSMSSEDLYRDNHSKERGLYQQVEHGELGKRWVLGPPFRFSETPARITSGGPLLGEHNQHVFCGLLGMNPADVEGLQAGGVIV